MAELIKQRPKLELIKNDVVCFREIGFPRIYAILNKKALLNRF